MALWGRPREHGVRRVSVHVDGASASGLARGSRLEGRGTALAAPSSRSRSALLVGCAASWAHPASSRAGSAREMRLLATPACVAFTAPQRHSTAARQAAASPRCQATQLASAPPPQPRRAAPLGSTRGARVEAGRVVSALSARPGSALSDLDMLWEEDTPGRSRSDFRQLLAARRVSSPEKKPKAFSWPRAAHQRSCPDARLATQRASQRRRGGLRDLDRAAGHGAPSAARAGRRWERDSNACSPLQLPAAALPGAPLWALLFGRGAPACSAHTRPGGRRAACSAPGAAAAPR